MNEKPPQFVVVDKRKFTSDGAIREGFTPPPEESDSSSVAAVLGSAPAAPPAPSQSAPSQTSPKPPPGRQTPSAIDQGRHSAGIIAGADQRSDADLDAFDAGEEALPAPTAKEAAEQKSAYQKSSKRLDDMLKQANPGMPPAEEVNFEALIQSLYMSAMVQLGGTAQPGEKPRVDIVAARQNIDLLGMLMEKTKGNLTTREARLLDSLLFDLRMAFLQVTNAISKSAARPASPGGLV